MARRLGDPVPRYLETADQLRQEVEDFMDTFVKSDDWKDPATQLAHIINLAVRCNPRQAQGTVRKNIVATAMKKFCRVTMTKETDPVTQRTFNKIHISAKEQN